MLEPIKLLSQSVVDMLASMVQDNLVRYRDGEFTDLATQNGWAIESRLASWNPELCEKLDPSGSPEAEIQNSLLVWAHLPGLTPALARDERVWARLCHVECLSFARRRWLKMADTDVRDIKKHFFAAGVGGCRDDNAIGRLWWNAYVASLACPDDVERGLRQLLKRANIRMQIVERANTGFREPLVRGLVRILEAESWLNVDDTAIVDFMIDVNKRSGSIVFEGLGDAGVDEHLRQCLTYTKARKPRVAA